MDAMEEIFGKFPRPSSADFWRLSEIVLQQDGGSDEAASGHDFITGQINSIIDDDALTYVALQRVLRATNAGMLKGVNPQEFTVIAGLFLEAFVFGAKFEKRGGHQD